MKKRIVPVITLAAGACVLAGGCVGQPGQGGAAAVDGSDRITAAGMHRDVEVLSADDMEGRGTGTPGEEKAAAYIEARFEEAGLEPVAGSYRQPVSLVGYKKNGEASSLAIRGVAGELSLADGENVSYWSSAQKERVEIQEAPLLFVGYGVEAPEYEWDDFKGADLEGKVLLFLNDDPPVVEDGEELFGGEARTYYGRWTYKFEQAMKHGAAGAFMIHTTPSASYPFSVIQYDGIEEHFALELPGLGYQVDLLGWLDEETAGRVAAAMGTTVEGLFEMGSKRDFAPVDTGFTVSAEIHTDIRELQTANVLGMLEGSDPGLKEQVIVFTAHYDHLGTNDTLEGDDTIFNGAWDNAAGTAGIIALAEGFAATEPRPARSLLFLACAAEEKGSLGSRWFVAKPPFERSRLVANLNVDMPQIFGITSDISAIGVETNTLGQALKDRAGAAGLTVTGDTRPSAGSFYRSDQVNFAKAGIPALFLNPGSRYLEPLDFDPAEYQDSHYHQVSDEITPQWNLAGLERDMRLVYETALGVANDPEMPRWAAGNEFEETWKELHGK